MIQLSYHVPGKDDNLIFVFQDKSGTRWFEPKEIPIVRKLHIANIYTKVYTGIRSQDITESLKSIEIAINERQNGKMQPNIAMVSHICRQLLSRTGYTVDMEALYELAAMYFIREGEHVEIVDHAISESKIKALKEIGINDFFFSKSLDSLFPFLNDFDGTLDEVAQVAKIEAESLLKQLKAYQNGR